jgi:hypothetical protein
MRDKVRTLDGPEPQSVTLSNGLRAHFDAARGEVVISSGVVTRLRLAVADLTALATLAPSAPHPD